MAKPGITQTSDNKAIPSLPKNGFWGCLPELVKDPLGLIKQSAAEYSGERYSGMVELPIPFLNPALILDPDVAHQILVKEVKRFKKSEREALIMGSMLGKGLVTNTDFESHKTQRKLTQPGFHFRRLESYGETMIDYTERYLESWQSGESRDVSEDMFKLTMFIVSKTLFDTDMTSMEGLASRIGQAIHDSQEAINKRFYQVIVWPDWVPTPNNLRIRRARQYLVETIEGMIAPRALRDGSYEDRGDLLSMLLLAEYEDGSRMPKKLVMDELITLFAAGHETTSNALTWALYLLARHPEIQQRLQAELDEVVEGEKPKFADLNDLKYTEMVFKESMRLYPPAWLLSTREATEDVELDGYRIPKGKMIYLSPYAQHFNPTIFSDPDKFDPERFNETNEKQLPRHAFMPFGAGGRVCIGNSFAMMEAKLILASLIKRFEFALCEETRIEMLPQITLSNKGGMPLKITARQISPLTKPGPQGEQLQEKEYARQALPET